jgi:hypothetical protein
MYKEQERLRIYFVGEREREKESTKKERETNEI